MDSRVDIEWPVEDIPDDHTLYQCVRYDDYGPDRELTNRVFSDKDGTGVSTFWCKYSTAQEARDSRKVPAEYDVYELKASEVRYTEALPRLLRVEHTPNMEPKRQAHASIFGFHKLPNSLKAKYREELLAILEERGLVPLDVPQK